MRLLENLKEHLAGFLRFRAFGSRGFADTHWRGELEQLERLVKERRFEQIEPALQALEQRLPGMFPDMRDRAGKLNQLATLYQDLAGNYADAERIWKDVLRLCESREDLHLEQMVSLNNLGLLYLHERRFGPAQEIFLRLLPMVQAHFGSEHPETATCLENLAAVYRHLGRTAEAARYKGRALGIRRASAKPAPKSARWSE
jgi:tetratricopeptide (TPR) repeat protein